MPDDKPIVSDMRPSENFSNEFVLPRDTKLSIVFETHINSDSIKDGQSFFAKISRDCIIDKRLVLSIGTPISGTIIISKCPGEPSPHKLFALNFDSINLSAGCRQKFSSLFLSRAAQIPLKRGTSRVFVDSVIPIIIPTCSHLQPTNAYQKYWISMLAERPSLTWLNPKKGKPIDVQVGDEASIKLAEDLRIPVRCLPISSTF